MKPAFILLIGLWASLAAGMCAQLAHSLINKDTSLFYQLQDPGFVKTLNSLGVTRAAADGYKQAMGPHFVRLVRHFENARALQIVAEDLFKNFNTWKNIKHKADAVALLQSLEVHPEIKDLKPDERFLLLQLAWHFPPYVQKRKIPMVSASDTYWKLRNNQKSLFRDHFEGQRQLFNNTKKTAQAHEEERAQKLEAGGYVILGLGKGVYRHLKIPHYINAQNNSIIADNAADIVAYDPRSNLYRIEEVKPLTIKAGDSSTYVLLPEQRLEKALTQLGSTVDYLRLKEGTSVKMVLQISAQDLGATELGHSRFAVKNSVLYTKEGEIIKVRGLPVFIGDNF